MIAIIINLWEIKLQFNNPKPNNRHQTQMINIYLCISSNA